MTMMLQAEKQRVQLLRSPTDTTTAHHVLSAIRQINSIARFPSTKKVQTQDLNASITFTTGPPGPAEPCPASGNFNTCPPHAHIQRHHRETNPDHLPLQLPARFPYLSRILRVATAVLYFTHYSSYIQPSPSGYPDWSAGSSGSFSCAEGHAWS